MASLKNEVTVTLWSSARQPYLCLPPRPDGLLSIDTHKYCLYAHVHAYTYIQLSYSTYVYRKQMQSEYMHKYKCDLIGLWCPVNLFPLLFLFILPLSYCLYQFHPSKFGVSSKRNTLSAHLYCQEEPKAYLFLNKHHLR